MEKSPNSDIDISKPFLGDNNSLDDFDIADKSNVPPNKNNKKEERKNYSFPVNLYNLNLPPSKQFEYNFHHYPLTDVQKTRNAIFKTLETDHFYWLCEVPEKKHPPVYYSFDLPPTKFKEEGQINYMNLPEYKFHSERQKLNSSQLKEVWNDRTFKVPSEMENLPHLWSISSWLLHSSKERTQFFKDTLAKCLRLFYAIPNVVNPLSQRVVRIDNFESLSKPNIFNVFVNIAAFFISLFDFFFGFRFRTLPFDYEHKAKTNANFKAFLELCNRKEQFEETYNLTNSIQVYQFLNSKNEEEKTEINRRQAIAQRLNTISQEFEKKFHEEMRNELNKDDYEEDEIEIISNNILATKQDKFYEFLTEMTKNNDSPKILPSVIKKMKAFQIYKELENWKSEEIEKERKKLDEKLKNESPIFYLIGYKRTRRIEQWLQKIRKTIEKEFQERLEKEFLENKLSEEIGLFKNFLIFSGNEERLIKEEIREMRKFCLQPVNKFTIFYPLFESQYKEEINEYGQKTIIKKGKVTIYSNFHFYKVAKAFVAYCIKLYSHMFRITKWIWDGPFGIRCLVLCSEFKTEYNPKQRPIMRSFLGVIHGIQKSRKRFEDAPDDGFFGKNFGRVLNILNCVIVRFIFVGVIIILIVHPIVNIFCIVGGIIAAITTFIWLVFVEIFLLIWKLLIYNYKSTFRHHTRHSYQDRPVEFYESAHLKLLRSYRFFPLLHLLWDFFINVIGQTLMVIIMMVFSPLISLFVLVFGVSLYVFKSIWDWFILNVIVRCFARVPSRNSTFAYRISGPGISRDFYNTLETKDLLALVVAFLEKLELDQVLKEGLEILEYPKKCTDEKCKALFDKFMNDNSQNEYAKTSFKNIQYLKDSLKNCVEERKKRLPTIKGGHHTIRFTKDELEKNELLVEEILHEVITEKNMDRYIWNLYDLRPGLFKRLTRKILQQILCAEAINPVEYIDHVEKVKFAQNTTNFSNYISKFINDSSEEFNKKKEKRRAYLKNMKQNSKANNKFFMNINGVLLVYSQQQQLYQYPFNFMIVNAKNIENWGEKKKEEQLELSHIKIQF